MEFQHFSHSHPLILNGDQQDEYDGEGGIKLPREIKHCLHPQHPLLLLAEPPPEYSGKAYFCDVCRQEGFSFVYHCSFCEFDLDIKCAFPPYFSKAESQGHQPKSIQYSSPNHPHPLIFNEEQVEYICERVICFGCGRPISGLHYRCTTSKFSVHKRCAELPKKIKHHLHPQHPLFLIAKLSSESWGAHFCDLCRKSCIHFCYLCSFCEFKLDINCAFPPCWSESESQGRHQFIRLLSSIQFNSSSFTCNFCGTQGNGFPYFCTLCQVILHEDCVRSPETINIRQHPHTLTYTYFPGGEEFEMPHCGVCQIQFNTGHGGYNCKGCNFLAHVNCAKEYMTTSFKIKTRKNESKDSSVTSTATAREVKHFSHEHNLALTEEYKSNVNCAGCMLPVLSTPYYGCSPCNFVLHEACFELKIRLQFLEYSASLSPMTSLFLDYSATLLPRAQTIDGVFRCDLCFQYCQGFAYQRDRSQMMFDVRCGKKLISGDIPHESHHEHRLFRTDANEGRRCKGCRKDCSDVSFRCAECDFDLDLRCAGLPREARHRYDEHPLLLTYIDPNSYQFVCQVCEKERDPKLWFYRCQECDFDAHVECVLREHHPYVKLGNTRTYDFHPHPLALVEKIGDHIGDYPECHNCGKPCDELALECIDPQCNFIIHSGGIGCNVRE